MLEPTDGDLIFSVVITKIVVNFGPDERQRMVASLVDKLADGFSAVRYVTRGRKQVSTTEVRRACVGEGAHEGKSEF